MLKILYKFLEFFPQPVIYISQVECLLFILVYLFYRKVKIAVVFLRYLIKFVGFLLSFEKSLNIIIFSQAEKLSGYLLVIQN